ncbi:MAG: hypothetical protein WCC03_17790 [Candidatus Acidiferrales bacterium]
MKLINANGFPITPSVVDTAMTESLLRWVISRAQHVALNNYALRDPVVLVTTVKAGEESVAIHNSWQAMYGLPVSIDDALAPGTMELRIGSTVLARIENLGVPFGMEVNA